MSDQAPEDKELAVCLSKWLDGQRANRIHKFEAITEVCSVLSVILGFNLTSFKVLYGTQVLAFATMIATIRKEALNLSAKAIATIEAATAEQRH